MQETAPEPTLPSSSFNIGNIAIWTAVALILAVIGWGLLNSQATRPEVGHTPPNFDMAFFPTYGLDNQTQTSLADLQGKVVVINFWASWCAECKVEANELETTWQKYQDQGVVFVGIAYADVESKSIDYLHEFNVTYPNAPDLGGRISHDYKITGVPETFFIGKDGKVAKVQIGPIDEATLHTTLDQLLQE